MLTPRDYTPPAGPRTLQVCELLARRGAMSCRQIAEALQGTTRNAISNAVHHAVRSKLLTADRSSYPHRFAACEGWRAAAELMAPQVRTRAPKPPKAAKPARPAPAPAKPRKPAKAAKAPMPQPAPLPVAHTPPPVTTVAHARRTQPTSVWALGACA